MAVVFQIAHRPSFNFGKSELARTGEKPDKGQIRYTHPNDPKKVYIERDPVKASELLRLLEGAHLTEYASDSKKPNPPVSREEVNRFKLKLIG